MKLNKKGTTKTSLNKTTKNKPTAASSVNNTSLNFSTDATKIGSIIPQEVMPLFSSISQSMGIDLSKPEAWTQEAITLVQQNKEQWKQAIEWLPVVEEAVGTFLNLQVSKAEFFARICTQMFGAKKKIDKASAQMLVSYFSYLKFGERLNNSVQKKVQLLDKKNEAIAKLQDDDLTAGIDYLNTVQELGSGEINRKYAIKESVAQALSDYRTQKHERRAYTRVGHLNPQIGQTVTTGRTN